MKTVYTVMPKDWDADKVVGMINMVFKAMGYSDVLFQTIEAADAAAAADNIDPNDMIGVEITIETPDDK